MTDARKKLMGMDVFRPIMHRPGLPLTLPETTHRMLDAGVMQPDMDVGDAGVALLVELYSIVRDMGDVMSAYLSLCHVTNHGKRGAPEAQSYLKNLLTGTLPVVGTLAKPFQNLRSTLGRLLVAACREEYGEDLSVALREHIDNNTRQNRRHWMEVVGVPKDEIEEALDSPEWSDASSEEVGKILLDGVLNAAQMLGGVVVQHGEGPTPSPNGNPTNVAGGHIFGTGVHEA